MVSWLILAVAVLVLGALVARALRRANRIVESCLAELPPPPGDGVGTTADGVSLARRAGD